MRKGIFLLERLTSDKIDTVVELGAKEIFVGHQNIDSESLRYAHLKNLKVNLEVGVFVGEELWEKYPDCRPIDKQGKQIEKIHWYAGVCPTHPDVRKEIFENVKNLVNKSEINGILLDFIRYPCHWEEVRDGDISEYCYCERCLEKFKREVGGKPEGEKWTAWKCKQITDFVADVRSLIETSHEKIELGIFLVPWRQNEFKGTLRKIVGQDMRELSQYCDTFSPMTYHRFTRHTTSWIHDVVENASTTTTKETLPLIQTEDRAGKITGQELEQALKEASRNPSSGVVIFFLEDLMGDNEKVDIIKGFL